MTFKVLLIEDDSVLATALHLMLTKRGYRVVVAQDGVSGLRKAYDLAPDLILLDVLLPDVNGWETCRRFRQMTGVPIIMLTALGSTEDVIKGLELGADVYLVKPVTFDELDARIRAVLRRSFSPNRNEYEWPQTVTYHELVIDFDQHTVTVKGKRVDLSPIEFHLLSLLAQNRGRVLPYSFLMREIWGKEAEDKLRNLRLRICSLRRKLTEDQSQVDPIVNERNLGYRFG